MLRQDGMAVSRFFGFFTILFQALYPRDPPFILHRRRSVRFHRQCFQEPIGLARAVRESERQMKASVNSITGEAVAGLLWMHLDIPNDASLAEVEECANDLVNDIRAGSSQAHIEQRLRVLQLKRFCRPVSLPAVETAARRSIAVVRSAPN
jgi:hypothetical protein